MGTNIIDSTSIINPRVSLGSYNRIGKNVIIDVLTDEDIEVSIGDNNIINDNTRILINGPFSCGDWNVFHNNMLIMPEKYLHIGHNCWFGQNTILDGAGGLNIGNGVRVGMYSQIWTHVASGEQIEGCTLFAHRATNILDEVWLVGSCVVGSGLTLERRTTALINSVLTKNTEEGRVYAGNPAKLLESANFYKEISLDQKFEMLGKWIKEFADKSNDAFGCEIKNNVIILINEKLDESVSFYKDVFNENLHSTGFFLASKTFIKTNSTTERAIYKYLYNNKARFTPINL